MEYKKVSLRSYNLHMIKTNNFKRIFVQVNFRKPIQKIDVTYRNMLSDILLDSNKNYPNNRTLAIEAEKRYDLTVQASNTRLGNYINSAYKMVALSEKYTEKGSFNEAFDFFMDILFNPNVTNKKFDIDSFNIVKNTLESQIKSFKDNKQKYSTMRMFEIMDSSSPLSLRGSGYLEDLENITQESLYEYYESMINQDLIDIYVLGDIDFQKITELFKNKFNVNTIKKPKTEEVGLKHTLRATPKKIIEFDDITQAKLSIGCKLNNLTPFESKYVMVIYDMLLGGDCNSKFFRDIREKKSLCYYINSSYNRIDNIIRFVSGIDKSKFNETVESIKTSMREMTRGNFTEEEIEVAKNNIISLLNSITDSPTRIINTYFSSEVTGLDDLEMRKEEYKKVTKEDIIRVSKKVKIDTIYLLSGGEKYEKK